MATSIFDPAIFFDTPFVETVLYYQDGEEEPLSVDAIVTRRKKNRFTPKRTDPQQITYPVELMIKKEDLASITIKRDVAGITNNRGDSDTVKIQEIMSQDSGVWNLGAI